MRTKVVKLLLKKELLDVFRDHKAVIMLVLVPLLVYPLIFFSAFGVMTLIQKSIKETEYRVLLDTDDGGLLEEQIRLYNQKNLEAGEESTEQLLVVHKSFSGLDDVDELLQNEEIDVYVTSEMSSDGRITYSTRYVSSITSSNYGEIELKEVLDELSDKQTREMIDEAGLDSESIMDPFDIERNNIASTEQSAGSILGMILPFMMIISLLMGTMYPAIDTTAGEKERGTLETLLTMPVKNHEIIMAKFLTVAIMGIISALLNLLSMGIMVAYLIRVVSLGSDTLGFDISGFHVATFIPASIVTILAVFAFSLFISAVTMCVAAFARSYKEANNYITPVTLVVMMTAYIGFIPNVELSSGMAMVPVANICLLIKNLLLFKTDMGIVLIVLLSNVIYAGFAVLFLGRIYNSEEILFDEGGSNLSLFQRRKNMKAGGTPTAADAWFVVCLVLIIYLYLGSLLQMKYGLKGVLYSQLLVLIIPLIVVIYTKCDIRKTYNLRKFSALDLIAALLLFAGTFIVESTISSFLYTYFKEDFDSMNSGLTDILMNKSIGVMFLVVAIAPAICEELMFRGFIQSGLGRSYKPVTTIILVSLIFGAYHTSLIRFLPTALLGACFAIITYYSKSIIPGMLMHCFNNSVAVIQMNYPGWLEQTFPLIFEEEPTVLSSVILAVIGILLIYGGMMIFIHKKNIFKKDFQKENDKKIIEKR